MVSQRKHLSDIAERQRLMAFLMAENQVCFYVPRDRNVWHSLCGNSAADIKGRSCCKWLVLWRNENVAPSSINSPCSCFPPRAEPLRRVVAALGYEKSLVIIDACENSLDSHTCPSAPLPPLARNSSGCPCSKSCPFPWHWSAINYATCCVLRLPHEYIDICSCEKSCPKNFDPSPHPPAPCCLSLAN